MKNSYGSSLAGTVVGEWEAVHDMAQPEASLTLPFHIVTLMARALLRHMAPLRRPLRPPPPWRACQVSKRSVSLPSQTRLPGEERTGKTHALVRQRISQFGRTNGGEPREQPFHRHERNSRAKGSPTASYTWYSGANEPEAAGLIQQRPDRGWLPFPAPTRGPLSHLVQLGSNLAN